MSMRTRFAPAIIVACSALAFSSIHAADAIVAPLLTKPLAEYPGKELLMITVTYPPGTVDPVHRHDAHAFIYVLEGEIVLVEDGGETVLGPGGCAGFKAGVPNGHQLVNKSDRDATYLEIGTRALVERVQYPDVDLVMQRDAKGMQFLNKSGVPYPPEP